MNNVLGSEHRFVFLSSSRAIFPESAPSRVLVCHDRLEIETLVLSAPKGAAIVSFNRSLTETLLARVVDLRADLRGSLLLTLSPPRIESIPALLSSFYPVFGLVTGFRWLPNRELVSALLRGDASERFIGGIVDLKSKTITLLKGDAETIIIPFSLFPPSGNGVKPDFAKLGFTDYGQTVRFGPYEAAADAILYETDLNYRRRLNRLRQESERNFGASLRRLRKQKGLGRKDFLPISSKEIARIERNEVQKPHAATLEVIADRLGVRPDEIESY